jgi:peptidyl-tRNA hydrolase, PTH1 family
LRQQRLNKTDRILTLRLIVGLGNPGQQYERTRHNAGFWFVDHLAARFNAKWSLEKRFYGRHAVIEVVGQKIQLLKPETFMNLSGQSVVALLKYYNIDVVECLVVHDELDFEPGIVRFKQGGGHAGHNGLRSIISCAGSSAFSRLRLGIGRPKTEQTVIDYVLATPTKADLEKIDAAMARVFTNLGSLVLEDFELVKRELHA